MRFWVNISVVFASLLVFGLLKDSFESSLREEMYEEDLLPRQMSFRDRDKLGQAGYAVILGGLRPTLASLMNLRAHNIQGEGDWYAAHEVYEKIVAMQPNSSYYWDYGAWHMILNASGDAMNDQSMTPAERELLWKEYWHLGHAFLEKGLEENPGDQVLLDTQATQWLNSHRMTKPGDAVDNFYFMLESKDENYKTYLYETKVLYTLLVIPGREAEAYEGFVNVWKNSKYFQRNPSVRVSLSILQESLQIAPEHRIPDADLFPNNRVKMTMYKNFYRVKCNTFALKRLTDQPYLNPSLYMSLVRTIRDLERELNEPPSTRMNIEDIYTYKPW